MAREICLIDEIPKSDAENTYSFVLQSDEGWLQNNKVF